MISQEVISFVCELPVGADRTISYILYDPSNFPKAAPKNGTERKLAFGFVFVLDIYLSSITEIHSKQFYNQHSKLNIKIANLLTAQIIALPTIATGNIQ